MTHTEATPQTLENGEALALLTLILGLVLRQGLMCSRAHYVAKDGLEHLTFLTLPPKC